MLPSAIVSRFSIFLCCICNLLAISSARWEICFNSSCSLFVVVVSLVPLIVWLCTLELSCSSVGSPNSVAKGLVAGVGEGIGVVLGVRTGGVAGSEIKLGTVGRENFAKKL